MHDLIMRPLIRTNHYLAKFRLMDIWNHYKVGKQIKMVCPRRDMELDMEQLIDLA